MRQIASPSCGRSPRSSRRIGSSHISSTSGRAQAPSCSVSRTWPTSRAVRLATSLSLSFSSGEQGARSQTRASSDSTPGRRGNTLLSRSLDKFQRLYCSGWLDVSVGSIVRRIVEERIWLEADEEASHRGMFSSDARPGTASGQVAGGESISTNMSRSSTHSSEGGPADASRGGALEQLKRLCVEVWESIYRNRHACPQ